MPFAIVGYFDDRSSTRIRDYWKMLADANICDYLHKSANSPHIKLGMFDEMDLDECRTKLEGLCGKTAAPGLHFKNLGIYPNEQPIFFIDVAVSAPLLAIRQEIAGLFLSTPKKVAMNYFDPGIWKPDCFLTMAIDRSKVHDALDVLLDMQLPFDGRLKAIGLIEFHPAKKIFEFPLQKRETEPT
jgi:hypothetical protein